MQKRLLYHIIFWISYLLFKTFVNITAAISPADSIPALHTVIIAVEAQLALLIVKIPMVYSIFFIAEKYLAKQWKTSRVILSVLVVYAICTAVLFPIVQYIIMENIYNARSAMADYFNIYSTVYNIFILSFTCSIALAIKLTRWSIIQKKKEKEIITEKLETELRFLKAQTNPHFLFNTLNNIYALARKKSDDTADVVLKLSKLLRFMLYESERKSIPVSEELKVIESYIELEKIRYSDKLRLSYDSTIDDPNQPIAPLILLPFIENAFKHGVSEARFSSAIHIDLKVQDGQLAFMIENTKTTDQEKSNTEKIGLNNVKRQLELMYPGHSLIIKNEPELFKISLKINLNNYAAL